MSTTEIILSVAAGAITILVGVIGALILRAVNDVDKAILTLSTDVRGLGVQDTAFAIDLTDLRAQVNELRARVVKAEEGMEELRELIHARRKDDRHMVVEP